MFHTLHKIELLIFWTIVIGVCLFLYQQRAILFPVAAAAEAFVLRTEKEPKPVITMMGDVLKVRDSSSIEFRAEETKLRYIVNFSGLVFPAAQSKEAHDIQLREETLSILNGLVLSNRVQIDFTFISEQRAGLGIVYAGKTNVNALLVREGLAQTKKEYLNGLGFKDLYHLLYAERIARRHERGLWKKTEPAVEREAATGSPRSAKFRRSPGSAGIPAGPSVGLRNQHPSLEGWIP